MQWWGVYGDDSPYTDDFDILFIDDDEGAPQQEGGTNQAVFSGQVTREDSGLTDLLGNVIYLYSVDIEPQEFTAATPLWFWGASQLQATY